VNEPTDGPDHPADSHDAVGSVSEEAMKLFGALSDWARDHGSDLGQGLSGLADQAAEAAREVNDHIATGAPECTWCPICRTVHVVRQASPEVRAHLAAAASSLLQAAAGALATAVPPESRTTRRGNGVEHIDLDDTPDADWPEED
jgi:hypothetical protein